MSGQPWETHDPLCPNRRPTIAFPNSACSGCRAVVAARAEGYARGLIEGDSGGRREGYRIGYDTAWSLSAAEIERQVREEEQVAQTLARAELYSMEEMDERCTQAADEAFAVGVKAARDAVTAVQAERGYDAAINWSEIGNEYAEGWTDLLSLILPAIDAIIDGSRNTG